MLYVYSQIEMGGFEARTSDLVIYHCCAALSACTANG
jgi:hypothetical protein